MIKITQLIKTIQGEVDMIGRPIILLRFTGCNLRCKWCDAYESSHEEKVIIENRNDYVLDIIKKEKNDINTILLTGGEPTLYFNDENKEFLNELSNMFDNIIIETNGLAPVEIYLNLDKYFPDSELYINCSPKLNLDAYKLYNNISTFEDVLELYKDKIPVLKLMRNIMFKFVYLANKEHEILKFIEHFRIPNKLVCILPLTPLTFDKENFLEEYRKSCNKTVNFCIKNNLRYSPREHIFLYFSQKNELEDLVKGV